MALALRQQGVFKVDQACSVGVSASAIRRRAAAGRLHRIHTGVYAIAPRKLLSRDALFMAAVLACGPGAALSHHSAASLIGLLRNNKSKIHLTVPGRSCHKRPGLVIHRSMTLNARDITAVQGIPCTTVARTLFDLSECVHHEALIRAFGQSEHMALFDLRALEDQLARNSTRRGAPIVRAVLREDYIESNPTRSEFEDALLPLVKRAGFPMPEVNEWIVPGDSERAICVDFRWLAQKLVVETDGKKTHRTVQAFERDRRNDQRLQAAGWRVIRVTWKQLQHEPRRVIDTIGALLVTKDR